MHRKLTAGCQILTLLLGFWRDPINITCKLPKDGPVLSHVGLRLRYYAGLQMTEVPGGILHLKPQQCVKYLL